MSSAARMIEEGRTFLTPGGTETFLLFQQGFPLREGCAFEIFEDEPAWARLKQEYLAPIFSAARGFGHGLLLDALVWRANPDWVRAIGRTDADVARFNELAVRRTREAVEEWRAAAPGRGALPVVLTADVGPRGDGYTVSDAGLTPEAAQAYHAVQIEALARAGVELVCALTLTTVAECVGAARAARSAGLPVIVSPTVETDGTLPDGTPLGELVRRVDDATGGAPLFYMVNCAHPTHVAPALARAKDEGAGWLSRFKGIRANSSRKSHAELDESPELDRGDPRELAREVAQMQREFGLCVVGGCCGTDAEHVAAIAEATSGTPRVAATA
jgi:S-methylmethionine-dependent homocysteine/selenocysteine methylase